MDITLSSAVLRNTNVPRRVHGEGSHQKIDMHICYTRTAASASTENL